MMIKDMNAEITKTPTEEISRVEIEETRTTTTTIIIIEIMEIRLKIVEKIIQEEERAILKKSTRKRMFKITIIIITKTKILETQNKIQESRSPDKIDSDWSLLISLSWTKNQETLRRSLMSLS